MEEHELRSILKRFADSGWELISAPAAAYLGGENCNDWLIHAVEQANEECGECGCEYDVPRYRFDCPDCGSPDADVLAGRELYIESFEAARPEA